jgi:hypothetical protein
MVVMPKPNNPSGAGLDVVSLIVIKFSDTFINVALLLKLYIIRRQKYSFNKNTGNIFGGFNGLILPKNVNNLTSCAEWSKGLKMK